MKPSEAAAIGAVACSGVRARKLNPVQAFFAARACAGRVLRRNGKQNQRLTRAWSARGTITDHQHDARGFRRGRSPSCGSAAQLEWRRQKQNQNDHQNCAEHVSPTDCPLGRGSAVRFEQRRE
jgi:hypothetical protein